ncbi:hypothetical protein SI859A1_02157 [Aurantimonas manganoxydans SI85-9A1]|uniref:Uncharacterized protein n=1 Tax=Aurantimonas manganoxydans (strain ATCC BAA-1229 / DSM 21871 / SI85-9A1) TaxID=287752 RepID=Q1YMN9_AURMS|nr:hypothetical protein SI859A1_02157 [Aurantimonas manganoxydans SI85-9A1]
MRLENFSGGRPHRGAQAGSNTPEDGCHRCDGFGGGLSVQPRGERHTGLSLMKDENRASALADDKINLPMLDLSAILDLGRTVMDGAAVLDRIARQACSHRAARPAPAQEIAPELLGLQRGAIDGGVDGLGGEHAQFRLRTILQSARDLLRRAAFRQALDEELAQAPVTLEHGIPPPALDIGSVGYERRIASRLRRSSSPDQRCTERKKA